MRTYEGKNDRKAFIMADDKAPIYSLDHDLITGMFQVYNANMIAIELIQSYLKRRN